MSKYAGSLKTSRLFKIIPISVCKTTYCKAIIIFYYLILLIDFNHYLFMCLDADQYPVQQMSCAISSGNYDINISAKCVTKIESISCQILLRSKIFINFRSDYKFRNSLLYMK